MVGRKRAVFGLKLTHQGEVSDYNPYDHEPQERRSRKQLAPPSPHDPLEGDGPLCRTLALVFRPFVDEK